MAHECISCGGECYCRGSISDSVDELTPANCTTCGCGDDEDSEDEMFDDGNYDDEDDEPEYYQCLGCRWTGDHSPGDICPRCSGATIEGVY